MASIRRHDLEAGVIDRFLVSPVHRSALMTGRVLMQAVTVLLQSMIIVGVALALGARFDGGAAGIGALLGIATLLGAAVAGGSNALAVLMRREESVIATVNFIAMPATFLSSTFIATSLAPHWMATAAKYNPVDWAVTASRAALAVSPDWTLVGGRAAALAALALLAVLGSTRAFRVYQRSRPPS